MPLLDLIWVMLMWFLFFAWIAVVILVVSDIFRSHDLGGPSKAGWVLFVILIPWLGTIVYLILRSDSMVKRYTEAYAAKALDTRTYQRQTGRYSHTDQLAELGRRREAGLVSGMDFDTQKARILT